MGDNRSVLLCGATGLVGGECLRLLLADPVFQRVVVLTRRPLPADMHTGANQLKLEQHVIDFDRLSAHSHLFQADTIICALGTTRKQAGSKRGFRRVDFGLTQEIARLGRQHGADHFLLVSSIGASARSSFFYTRVKGEIEDAVSSLDYRALSIVRPSLLLGKRREPRLGEQLAAWFAFLTPARYKPVPAPDVAAALVQLARENVPGRRIVESRGIPPLAKAYFARSAGSGWPDR
jgi:uncharacterized protein YbjT (DUF2867 family)